MSTVEKIKDLLLPLVGVGDTDWAEKARQILCDPTCQASVEINSFEARYVLGTTDVQNQTLSRSSKKFFGFTELSKNLRLIGETDKVFWVTIFSEDWIGRCILNHDETSLLGCAFVERTSNNNIKAPPNWDGTQEMLARFYDKEIFERNPTKRRLT